MTIAFILSMPGVGSWNGQWSGNGNLYAVTRKVGTITGQRILAKGYFGYNFGDGWRAVVTAKEMSGPDLRQLRKNSKGFCGYDWMVDSIIQDGAIYGPTQPKPEKGKASA